MRQVLEIQVLKEASSAGWRNIMRFGIAKASARAGVCHYHYSETPLAMEFRN